MSQSYFRAFCFVTDVLSPYISKNKILHHLKSKNVIEWEQVADVAGSHSVTQALYPAFVQKELVDSIPDEFLSYVQQVHEVNCERNEMMKNQLMDAVFVINRLGIKPLLMKGAAHLFLDTFSNIGDRLLVDLDILVPYDDIERTSNELIKSGYKFFEEQIYFIDNHHHYPALIKQDECATIELHRELMFREQQHIFPTEYAWGNSVDITLPNKAEVKILNPTYRVFHSFLHRNVVDMFHLAGCVEIRQLHELVGSQLKYSSEIDWRELFEYAKKSGVERKLAANINIANKFMGFPKQETITNLHQVTSAFHYARVCAKLKFGWLNYIDINNLIVRLRRSIRRIPFHLSKFRRKSIQA